MNNDIKEILREIKSYENEEMCIIVLTQQENIALLDYITNLQEERDFYKCTDSMNVESNIELRARIDKAIEILKESGCYDEETKAFCDCVWEELPIILKILTGGDE